MVFSGDSEKKLHTFDLSLMASDSKLDIFFDSTEALKDTAELLKFNCPSEGCEYVSNEGYLVLKAHVSSVHNKSFW